MSACFECGTAAEHNHHVVPKVIGGTRTIPLCAACHGKVHGLWYGDHGALVRAGQEKARGRKAVPTRRSDRGAKYRVEIETEENETARRVGEQVDTLTDEERQCIVLHTTRGLELDALLRSRMSKDKYDALLRVTRSRLDRRSVSAGDGPTYAAAGYTVSEGTRGRVVVQRRYVELLGYDTIAFVTGLTINRVRARCATAERKIRDFREPVVSTSNL